MGKSTNPYVLRQLVLVPPDQVKPEYRLKRRAYRAPFQPYRNAMAERDEELFKIMGDKKKSLPAKAQDYQKALEQFLTFQERAGSSRARRPPPPPPPLPPAKTSTPEAEAAASHGTGEEREKTLDYLNVTTKSNRTRANMLLDRLKQAGVTWDEYGRVVYPDTGVDEYSNLTDLVHDVVAYKAKSPELPTGAFKFYEVLKKHNLPATAVGNRFRKPLVHQRGAYYQPVRRRRAEEVVQAPSPMRRWESLQELDEEADEEEDEHDDPSVPYVVPPTPPPLPGDYDYDDDEEDGEEEQPSFETQV